MVTRRKVWTSVPMRDVQALFDAQPGTRSNLMPGGPYGYTARHGALIHRVYVYGLYATEPGFECESLTPVLPPRHTRSGPVLVGSPDVAVTCLLCSAYEPTLGRRV